MKKLLLILFLLLIPSLSWGQACNTTIAASDTFPCEMSSAGTTYTLSENIVCDHTCLTVTANNVVLDLNNHTMTWGNARGVTFLNSDFTAWTGGVPDNWTVLSGTTTQRTSQWPDHTYDCELSATASIKSSTVTLTANQTYWFGTWLRGVSPDSYTIYIKKASDDSVLASYIPSMGEINGGMASSGYLVGQAGNDYRPTINTDVYLQIDCTGTAVKRIAMAQISASKQFGIFNMNYLSASYSPDLDASLMGGVTNFTLKACATPPCTGAIVQGAANAVNSGSIILLSVQGITLQNINITQTGRNTGSVYVTPSSGDILIDNVDSTTTSDANFNRAHVVIGMSVSAGASVGSVEVKNCEMNGDPQTGISVGSLTGFDGTISVHDNIVKNKEYMSNGYGMGIGGKNVSYFNNKIQPVRGRGLMIGGIVNGNINKNEIHANDEIYLLEYPTSIETYAIRLRTSELAGLGYGSSAMYSQNVKIYDNSIYSSVKTTGGVDAAYGMDITNTDVNDSIQIYNNSLTVTTPAGKPGYGIQWVMSKNIIKQIIRNNIITAPVGLRFTGHVLTTWPPTSGFLVYNNVITTTDHSFYFNVNNAGALIYDIDIFCNKIIQQGTSSYPFYLSGNLSTDISDVHISNNEITNSNSSGYEVYTTGDMSTLMYFCGNGTIDVNGGGSVGAETPCQDGSTGCYAMAGIIGENPNLKGGSVSGGVLK